MKIAQNRGLTLIELVIVIAIIGTLAAIAVPSFTSYRDKAKMTRAILDLGFLEKEVLGYYIENDFFPETLAAIGMGSFMDPWNRRYQYLRIEQPDDGKEGKTGKARKDHFLVPVNTDFDLYSMGPNGKSSPPFTAKNSRDDIVRANNGQYHGLASEY